MSNIWENNSMLKEASVAGN